MIDDDPGNSALQRLRFWVDTDEDADFSDETELMGGSGTTTIDDVWSGGYAGLHRGGGASQQYDDFKIDCPVPVCCCNNVKTYGGVTTAGDELVHAAQVVPQSCCDCLKKLSYTVRTQL